MLVFSLCCNVFVDLNFEKNSIISTLFGKSINPSFVDLESPLVIISICFSDAIYPDETPELMGRIPSFSSYLSIHVKYI